MRNDSKLLDDFSKLFGNAIGLAQGAKTEADTMFKGFIERWLAEQNLVTREEFEATRATALQAQQEIKELRERISVLEGGISQRD